MGEEVLVKKLFGLFSMKGEDIMLHAASEDQVKYQRLRSSLPAKFWKWKTVAGWRWKGNKDHINVLEMRAVLTTLRWRLERQRGMHCKFVHLVDSLVCLHSSKKLERTLLRSNALLLASRSQAVWAYVHACPHKTEPRRRPQQASGKT